ncbi:bifunctional adenosylcobinamide kinase/adenosylcobinamide-phosphate guanylyltransferase [Niastella caeni]|uniref:Adenosylcobinamide kinase n=1 Tax=Niastella caeni TaxID=2569763 RepID=A0A4S8I025_9BACT|nr:bifunctional adenosylcobinamide kinase/adenosylcobinamide-phosphate guanylyltransferase [Niastella caeni]THU41468.1 bifunctional adenosylcobinamide kinase/adenosylcobinamide-phosphate guanylyltransferase [Niastella caeni]
MATDEKGLPSALPTSWDKPSGGGGAHYKGIVFITGGARSGKSRYAQQLALQLSNNPVYLATARHWDDDFEKRIQRHQAERDERWTSIEEEKNISGLSLSGKVVVMDCVTLWITNFFTDNKYDIDASLQQCKVEIDKLDTANNTFIIISNELGMGMHAETEIGRKFTDLQGWMNQYIAQKANQVIFMVSGIPMVIK